MSENEEHQRGIAAPFWKDPEWTDAERELPEIPFLNELTSRLQRGRGPRAYFFSTPSGESGHFKKLWEESFKKESVNYDQK